MFTKILQTFISQHDFPSLAKGSNPRFRDNISITIIKWVKENSDQSSFIYLSPEIKKKIDDKSSNKVSEQVYFNMIYIWIILEIIIFPMTCRFSKLVKIRRKYKQMKWQHVFKTPWSVCSSWHVGLVTAMTLKLVL